MRARFPPAVMDMLPRWRCLQVAWVCCGLLTLPNLTAAQVQFVAPEVTARAGLERLGTQDGSALAMTPLMLEAAVRFWTDEQASFLWGGGLRADLGGAGSVGIVPRVELRHPFGGLELRPGIALPVYLAPLTMFGPELSGGVRYPLTDRIGLTGYLCLSAFIFGSDVPRDSTIIQLTGAFGVDLVL